MQAEPQIPGPLGGEMAEGFHGFASPRVKRDKPHGSYRSYNYLEPKWGPLFWLEGWPCFWGVNREK